MRQNSRGDHRPIIPTIVVPMGQSMDYHGKTHDYHGKTHDYHGEIHDYHGKTYDYHDVFLLWVA